MTLFWILATVIATTIVCDKNPVWSKKVAKYYDQTIKAITDVFKDTK